MKMDICDSPAQCRVIWEKAWPVRSIFDLWQVRLCFHGAFDRPIAFYYTEQGGILSGLLPLSWNEETDAYVMFPGETWQGKTWLEQNRLVAETPDILELLLEAVPGNLHLRYLVPGPAGALPGMLEPDEIGYLFYPPMCDYTMESYWQGFSAKTRKHIHADLAKLEKQHLSFHHDDFGDLFRMFDMNIRCFGSNSYFSDPRFYRAFENLAGWARDSGMLRVTSLRVGGRLAAVDMGLIFKNTYTLVAGGVDPEFPGAAKHINLHHLEWACRQQCHSVDFLCGDFNWKKRFHLTPRPLYQICIHRETEARNVEQEIPHVCCS